MVKSREEMPSGSDSDVVGGQVLDKPVGPRGCLGCGRGPIVESGPAPGPARLLAELTPEPVLIQHQSPLQLAM